MTSDDTRSLAGLMVEIIQWPGSGLDLVEPAGELIAENARFNRWAHERKTRSTDAEMWNLAALAQHLSAECESAWHRYRASEDQRLPDTLRQVIDRLRVTRESDTIDYEDPDLPEELHGW